MTGACPACGKFVEPRGLSSHMRGKECRAAAKARELRSRGLVPVSTSKRSLILAAGLPYEDEPTLFIRQKMWKGGQCRMTTSAQHQLWVAPWIAETVKEERLLPRVRRRILIEAQGDPNIARTLLTIVIERYTR